MFMSLEWLRDLISSYLDCVFRRFQGIIPPLSTRKVNTEDNIMKIDLKKYDYKDLWDALGELSKVIPESDNKLLLEIGAGVIREIDTRLQTEYEQ